MLSKKCGPVPWHAMLVDIHCPTSDAPRRTSLLDYKTRLRQPHIDVTASLLIPQFIFPPLVLGHHTFTIIQPPKKKTDIPNPNPNPLITQLAKEPSFASTHGSSPFATGSLSKYRWAYDSSIGAKDSANIKRSTAPRSGMPARNGVKVGESCLVSGDFWVQV